MKPKAICKILIDLNRQWHQNLFRGRFTPSRILSLILDLLLFMDMLGLMASGILLSNHVFAFMDVHGGLSFARLLHMAASHWGFVLMALHLGLHWGIFMGFAKKVFKLKQPSRACKILFPVFGVGIAIYGLIVFIRRDLLTYMLVRTQFVFLDFTEPIPMFYLDYLAMMGTFVFLAYYVSKLLRILSGKRNHKKDHEIREGFTKKQNVLGGNRS